MIEWYTMGKEDQVKLARVLDIIHNLKVCTIIFISEIKNYLITFFYNFRD